MITAQSLADNNLAYREPALYDEMLADDTVSDEILDVVDRAGATVGSVLDLGCGTGRVLADLHSRRGWQATGVDLQPGLLDHARARYAGLVLYGGDIRSVRLDTTFDLVLCLGNTLAYLHTEAELADAFATMAAHAHTGTLLAVATLDAPARDGRFTTRLHSEAVGEAQVDTTTRYDPDTGMLTSTRSWRLASGRLEEDHITRRIWSRKALLDQAALARFECVPAPHNPDLTLCAVHT